ncbi:MAG: 4Fe-4S dicluster domain-containing protein [Bacillota bacterium]
MAELIPINYLGKKHLVPEGVTIMSAVEYSGHRLIRGCGCRGGFCGACATVYRVPGDHQIKVGLACQTRVEAGMDIAILPYYPAQKSLYDFKTLENPGLILQKLYPEMFRCLGCSACSKICPQDLPVMDIIAAAQRGNLAAVAELSFDCVMCGLCASRCLAQMVPYNIAMVARRLYSRTALPRPEYVRVRIEEIGRGVYSDQIDALIGQSQDELQKLYAARDIECI